MKRERRRRGGASTVIENVHDDDRFNASVATHSTGVDPTANADPDDGVHATVTGCCPSVVAGMGKLTWVVAPPLEIDVIGAGQVSPGGAMIEEVTAGAPLAWGAVGVGELGVWHPAANNT